MSNERKILAYKLKEYRKINHLNQFDFAEDCGISRETLSLIERQLGNVTIDTAHLLASRIGITVSDLLSPYDVTYYIFPSKIILEETEYTTYGIAAVKNGFLTDYILDITSNLPTITALVGLCNEQGLSPIHLRDVAEDALIE